MCQNCLQLCVSCIALVIFTKHSTPTWANGGLRPRRSRIRILLMKKIKLKKFTEFSKNAHWILFWNSVLQFGLKNYNHTSSQSQKHWTVKSRLHDVTATLGKTPPYRAVQNLKICRHKKVINNLYSSTTQHTGRQTDRQKKIQLTNTTNTKLRPKVTKCEIIHAVHFCHCA